MSSSDKPIDEATVKAVEGQMDEAMRWLFELLSRPGMCQVWTRLDCLEYMPVVRDDGSIEFVLNAEHTERNAWLDAMLGRLRD